MRKIALMCVVTVLLVLTGCTTVLPVTATGNTIGSKVGEASGGFLFAIPLNGNSSIRAAAGNAGITTVSTVDLKITTYLGVYTTVTTIVTGE